MLYSLSEIKLSKSKSRVATYSRIDEQILEITIQNKEKQSKGSKGKKKELSNYLYTVSLNTIFECLHVLFRKSSTEINVQVNDLQEIRTVELVSKSQKQEF